MPTTKRTTKPVRKISTASTAPQLSEQAYYPRTAPMQTTTLVIIALVAILSFATGYLFSQVRTLASNKTTPTTTTQQTAQAQPDVKITMDQVKGLFNSQKLVFGDKNSKLLFVEFSDPSCPFCHVAGGKNPEVAKQTNLTYKDDGGTYVPPITEIRKLVDAGQAGYVQVYTNGHGNGEVGAQALYCANEKGAFWQAHDLLMSNDGYSLLNNDVQNNIANDQKVVDFLANIVDPSFMKDCLDSQKYKDQLSKDQATANQFGVTGTPHFLVNTTAYRGAYSYTDMESTVKAALGQ
jgi:protein-disulfide isomerase